MVAKNPARMSKSSFKVAKAAKRAEATALAQDQGGAASPATAGLDQPAAAPATVVRKNAVKVDVARAAVRQIKVVDTDLVLIMDDGRTVYVRDGAVQAMIDQDFAVDFADGATLSGQEMLHSAEPAEVGRIAITGASPEGAAGSVVTDAPLAPAAPAPSGSSSSKWQTYALIGAPLIGGGLAGVLSKGSGSSATTTQGGGTTVPATKTVAPVIYAVNGNNVINAAQKGAGVSVTGTAEGGSTVTVTFGATQKTATASATGTWSVSFLATELPADAAQVTLSATAKSSTGTVSDPATRDVRLDTTGPAAPTIFSVTGDNVLSPAEQQAAVTVNGSSEPGASVVVKWGTVTKSVVADPAGNWSAKFEVADVPKTPGTATLTAVATDTVGNVGATAELAVTISPAVEINGTVSAGRALSGNGLVVSIYSADGRTLLAGNVKVSSSGTFAASGLSVGNGEAVIAVVTDLNDAADYLDEATGLGKSLGTARLLASGVVSGATLNLNINPLTTIAAQKAGLAEDGSGSVTAANVTLANNQVAQALGLGKIDITAIAPAVTNGGSYNPADGLSAAEKAGALLAALSGADANNGGSVVTTMAALSGEINGIRLSDAGQLLVVNGAVKATPATAGSLQSTVSDLIAQSTAPTQLTIDAVAGDNVVAQNELAGLSISGSVVAGASAVNLTFGTVTRSATISGTTWSYAVTAEDIAALGGNGVAVIGASAILPSSATATASRAITLATVLPAKPEFDAIGGDGWINAAEARTDFTVTGYGTAGSKIVLAWGTAPEKTATVGANGSWSVKYLPSELPTAASSTLTARAVDQFGNTSAEATATARYDIVIPDKPTIDPINSTNRVGLGASASGVVLTGTGEAGATLSVIWGSRYRNDAVTVGSDGKWQAQVFPSQLPDNGVVNVQVKQADAAGNVSPTEQMAVTVAVTPPPAPIITSFATDNYVNANELKSVQAKGTGSAGQTVYVKFGSFTRSSTVAEDGSWTVTFPSGFIPADGVYANVTAWLVDSDQNKSADFVYPQTVTVDTQINKPIIDQIGVDGRVNAAEASTTFTVTGTADSDAASVLVKLTKDNVMLTATGRPAADGKWTATFSGNATLTDGTWTATATVTDLASNSNISDPVTFIVDTVAPSSPTLAPINGNGKVGPDNRDNGTQLAGTGEAGARVVIEWWLAGKRVLTTEGTTIVVDENSAWSYLLPGTRLPDDNTYQVQVKQTDVAGNVSAVASSEVVVKTNALPRPTIGATGTDDFINLAERSAAITVIGTAPTGAAGQTITVTLNNRQATGTVNNDLSWSVTFAAGTFTSLADGNYDVSAVLSDSFGNTSQPATRPVVVDTTLAAPALAENVTTDGVINIAERDGGFSVTATGASDVVSMVMSVGGKTSNATKSTVGGVTTWSARFDNLTGATFNTDNTVDVTATATDTAGNTRTTAVKKVTTDFAAPAVPTINRFGTDGYIGATDLAGDIQITGTSEQNVKVAVTLGTVTTTVDADTAGRWSATFSGTNKPAGGAGSTVDIKARAIDAAGNVSAVAASSVIVDTVVNAPVVTGVLQADGTTTGSVVNKALKDEGTVFIVGTAEVGSLVTINWGNKEIVASEVADAQGNWKIGVADSDVPADGTASITATTTDRAGNVSLASKSFATTIDTVLATPTFATMGGTAFGAGTFYLNKAALAPANIAVSGNAENGATVQVQLLRDNTSLGSQTITAGATGWSTSFAKGLFGNEGTYTLKAIVTDRAGNSATITRDITVDSQAPTGGAIDPVAVDNIVTNAELRSGVTISGTGEVGAKATVNWGGINKTVDAIGASGNWSVRYSALEVPASPNQTLDTQVSVVFTDKAGNSAPAVTRAVSVDPGNAAAPTINPVAVDNIISQTEKNGTITITGTTADTTDTVQLTIHQAGTTSTANDVVRNATSVRLVSGVVTWSLTLLPADIAGLAEGEYTFTAKSTNGSRSAESQPLTVILEPPVGAPTFSKIAHDGVLSLADKDGGFTVTGFAAGVGDTVTVKLLDGDSVLQSVTSAAVGTDKAFTVTFTTSGLTGLTNGASYRFVAYATNNNNTSAETEQNVTANFTLPVLTSFTSDTGDGFYNTGDVIVLKANFNSTVKAGSTLIVQLSTNKSVTLTAAADGNTLTGTYTVGAGENATRLTVSQITTINVKNLLDNAQTSTTVPANSNLAGRKIVIDTVANDVLRDATLLAAPGTTTGVATRNAGPNFAGTTQGALRFVLPSVTGSFVADEQIQVIDKATGVVVASYAVPAAALDGSGQWSAPSALTLTPTVALAEGSYTFAVRVVDRAGNVSAEARRPLTVVVDRTAPVIDLNGTATGADNTIVYAPTASSPSVALVDAAATVKDSVAGEVAGAGSGVSQILVKAAGLGTGTVKDLLSVNGATNLQVNGVAVTSGWNADGTDITTITFTLGGVNWRGTYNSETQTFAFVPVSGTASNPLPAVATTDQAQALIRALRYTDPNTTVADGARAFTISAVDGAGNVSATATSAVVVNNVRPTAAATSPIRGIDTNGDGKADNAFRIAFSEAVLVSAVTNLTNWTGANKLGTDASVIAIDPVLVNGAAYATAFRIVAGNDASYVAGDQLVLNKAAAIGTGGPGDTATANIAFTLPALAITITGGTQYFRPVAFDGGEERGPWNYVNAAEKAGPVSGGLVDIGQVGYRARYYINGIEQPGKFTTVAGTGETAGSYRWSVTNTGSDWGADGIKLVSVKFEDNAGNISRYYDNRKVMVDTVVKGITSLALTTDGGTAGAADQGDVVTITFAEPVSLTSAMLPAAFGAGASVTALTGFQTVSGYNADTKLPVETSSVYATAWRVTLGTNPTLAEGQPLSIGPVTDMAGNPATLNYTTPTDLFDRPGTPLIGNVTSDNVINGSENGAAQSVTISVGGAKTGDTVILYRDGVQVGKATFTDSAIVPDGLSQVAISIPAGAWGADGEHALTATVQRGTGPVATSAVRSVYVSAQGAHWSQVSQSTIWFDPDTLVQAEGSTVTTWNASTGKTKTGGTLNLATKAGTTPVQFSRDALGHVQLYFSGTTSTGSVLVSNGDVALPSLAGGFANYSVAKLLGVGSTVLTSYVAAGNNTIAALLGALGDPTSVGSAILDVATLNGARVGQLTQTNSTGVTSTVQPYNPFGLWRTQALLNDGQTVSYQVDSLHWWGDVATSTIGTTSTSTASNLQIGGSSRNTLPAFRGMVGDQILFGTAITAAMADEVNVYLAVKYGSLGSVVPITATRQSYDLSAPGGDPSLIDQVLQLGQTSLGIGADIAIVAGADYVNMGVGSDTVRLKDLKFRTIDGGIGFDTLVLDGTFSTAASGSVFNLSDYVSNARGIADAAGSAADDARVNLNGYHALRGIEKIDLSRQTDAQTVKLTFADINQLAERQAAGDPNAAAGKSNLYLALGANDRLDTTGLGEAEYGSWTDLSGLRYDHRYTDGTVTLYVSGGASPVAFKTGLASIARSATSLSFELDAEMQSATLSGGDWTVNSGGATITASSLANVNGAGVLTLTGTGLNGSGVLDLSYGGPALSTAEGYGLRWSNIAIGSDSGDSISLTSKGTAYAIFGGGGADTISGTNFSDLIVGGFGNDTLAGGGGADVFRVVENDTGIDTINDFKLSESDTIDLSSLLAHADAGITRSADGAVNAVSNLKLTWVSATDAMLWVDTGGNASFDATSTPYGLLLKGVNPVGPVGGDATIGGKSLVDLINQQVVLIG